MRRCQTIRPASTSDHLCLNWGIEHRANANNTQFHFRRSRRSLAIQVLKARPSILRVQQMLVVDSMLQVRIAPCWLISSSLQIHSDRIRDESVGAIHVVERSRHHQIRVRVQSDRTIYSYVRSVQAMAESMRIG
ncbi:MAG: hypothetical protein AAGD25_31155 [Cyanobacteria bacterium P01_F01_bin.150]